MMKSSFYLDFIYSLFTDYCDLLTKAILKNIINQLKYVFKY